MRAFIAVEVSDDVRGRLTAVIETLRRTGAHVSWVPPANLHVSLAFLGDVDRERIGLLSDALGETAGQVVPCTVQVRRVGTFGTPRSPRVLWAGVDGDGTLQNIYRRLATHLETLELPVEKRAYLPHVTLGRVRSDRGRGELVAALSEVGETDFGAMDVGRVVLMQSRLLPQGAQYSVLHAAEL